MEKTFETVEIKVPILLTGTKFSRKETTSGLRTSKSKKRRNKHPKIGKNLDKRMKGITSDKQDV